MRVALVGCGNIAARYAARIVASPELTLVGATDIATARAAALVAEFGGAAYTSLEALLADETVDTVVNLTVPEAHAAVTAASLEAGKHVHTEKPMAFSYTEAQELCALSRRNDRRLSCSPATLLGEAQQTAWKLVREGVLGTIRAVYAEANWGRIETWHPSPVSIYASGPLFDVGIYPLTIVTAMLGPARRVLAYGTALEPDRVTLDGRGFRLETPDFAVALIELESGVVVRLTATFWVGPGRQRGLELHGETASLYLETWLDFDSVLELSADGKAFTPVPPVREPFHGIDWGAAVVDLAGAITEGRPHRASAEHAAHVVELLSAVTASIEEGGAVEVRSSFVPPEPLEWAR